MTPHATSPQGERRRAHVQAEGPKLEEVEVIVSGGRGLGRAKNFALLQELAKILGGVVGGSRVAIDNAWLPSTRQVEDDEDDCQLPSLYCRRDLRSKSTYGRVCLLPIYRRDQYGSGCTDFS